MRRSSGAGGLILALPLLVAAAPPAAETCPAPGEGGVHIDPILLSGVESGRRTHVAIDAVVAEEVVQIAERGWMLGAALRLPGEALAFPAGTALAPGYAAHQPLCLPRATQLPPGATGQMAVGGGRLACLIDGDGDGAYEQVQMLGTNYAMHVPQARPYRLIRLQAPVRLVENPLGQPETRRQVLRRIVIGDLRGDTATFRLSHAFREARPRNEDAWDREAGGTFVYRLPPAVPVPIDRSESYWASNASEEVIVPLVQDRVIEVGGLQLRIERPSWSRTPGWNIVPLAAHFPRWIHYGCGGRTVRLGAETG